MFQRKCARKTRARLPDGEPNPIDKHVGARIRLRRTVLGLSQQRLGQLLGLTFQQVQKYEQGGNRVSASRLYDLSRVLKVPIGYFFDDITMEAISFAPGQTAAGCAPRLNDVTGEKLLDPAFKRETLELIRNYYRISDNSVRRQVYELAMTLAESELGPG